MADVPPIPSADVRRSDARGAMHPPVLRGQLPRPTPRLPVRPLHPRVAPGSHPASGRVVLPPTPEGGHLS